MIFFQTFNYLFDVEKIIREYYVEFSSKKFDYLVDVKKSFEPYK